jgi:hypothetical protein
MNSPNYIYPLFINAFRFCQCFFYALHKTLTYSASLYQPNSWTTAPTERWHMAVCYLLTAHSGVLPYRNEHSNQSTERHIHERYRPQVSAKMIICYQSWWCLYRLAETCRLYSSWIWGFSWLTAVFICTIASAFASTFRKISYLV